MKRRLALAFIAMIAFSVGRGERRGNQEQLKPPRNLIRRALESLLTICLFRAFGLRPRPPVPDGDMLRAKIDFDPHRCRDINQIIDAWLPLTLAMNCINRSMGQPDLYPVVLSPRVIDKLGYIGNLIHAA